MELHELKKHLKLKLECNDKTQTIRMKILRQDPQITRGVFRFDYDGITVASRNRPELGRTIVYLRGNHVERDYNIAEHMYVYSSDYKKMKSFLKNFTNQWSVSYASGL